MSKYLHLQELNIILQILHLLIYTYKNNIFTHKEKLNSSYNTHFTLIR